MNIPTFGKTTVTPLPGNLGKDIADNPTIVDLDMTGDLDKDQIVPIKQPETVPYFWNNNTQDKNVDPMDVMKLPPPFAKTTIAVNGPIAENIPGEIKIGKDGQLLIRTIKYQGIIGDKISAYDNFVVNRIAKIVGAQPIDLGDNSSVHFINPQWMKPRIPRKSGTEQLFPFEAAIRGYSYSATLYVDLIQLSNQPVTGITELPGTNRKAKRMVMYNGFQQEIMEIGGKYYLVKGYIPKEPLGSIPVMLGSILDNLRGLSQEQRLSKGECTTDPGGYFIVSGSRRLVLQQDKLRKNRWHFFPENGVPVLRMTCIAPKKSSRVSLIYNSKVEAVELMLPFLGKEKSNYINVLQIYRLFGIADMTQIMILILNFTRPNLRERVRAFLLPTQINLMTIADDYLYIAKITDDHKLSPIFRKSKIDTAINKELFPQMATDGSKDQLKIYFLSLLVAQYVEVMIGERKLDDRDDYGNKRLDDAARMMEQLFSGIWNGIINGSGKTKGIRDKIASARTNLRTIGMVKQQLNQAKITTDFQKSFRHKWGISNATGKEGVTDSLDRGSTLTMISQLRRIVTPGTTRTKNPSIRMVQFSQLGYIDPVETPEGEKCGLNKFQAMTCFMSIDRDEANMLSELSKHVSETLDPLNIKSAICIFNGQFLGWCVGEVIRDHLIKLRRIGQISFDTEIVLTEDNILHIYNDGGRPTRPLLIVDQTDGRLVIDKKKLWNADFSELLRQGAVEYISAFEANTIYLAMSVNSIAVSQDTLRELSNTMKNNDIMISYIKAVQKWRDAKPDERRGYNASNYGTVDDNDRRPVLEPKALQGIYEQKLARVKEEEIYDLNIEEIGPDDEPQLVKIRNRPMDEQEQVLIKLLERENPSIIEEMKKINSKRYFTHCEIDPNSMFGIASSIIPLPEHNPGPRNAYQCVVIGTKIKTPTGPKAIETLRDGDTVITFNKKTLKMEPTKIKNHFVISSEKEGKNVYEIKTYSDRNIKATGDHPFVTLQGDVRVDKLDTSIHHIGISPGVIHLVNDAHDKIIVTKNQAKSALAKLGLKESLITKHTDDLEKLSILPLNQNSRKLAIISRMYGFLLADGHIGTSEDNGKYFKTAWIFGRPNDAELFVSDLVELGFDPVKICEQKDNFTSNGSEQHTWSVRKCGSFASLFALLGAHIGNKTESKTPPIPDWIMNGCKLVKREFISGFMGGDGSKIYSYIRPGGSRKGHARYGMNRIVLHKRADLIESLKEWYEQLKTLFLEFDIPTGTIHSSHDYDNKHKVCLDMTDDSVVLSRYMDVIGYRYATTKYGESLKVTEWLKYKEHELEKLRNLKKYVIKLRKTGLTQLKIANLCGIHKSKVQGWTGKRKNSQVKLTKDFILLEDWLKSVEVKNGCIFQPIKSIREIDHCMVSDFETESENHTFIAGPGYLSLNCKMGQQSLGVVHSNLQLLFETTTKALVYPQRPLFETQMANTIGLNTNPAGQNVIIAIAAFTGYNIEDAIIFNKGSIERGLFMSVVYKSIKSIEKYTNISGGENSEKFGRPPVKNKNRAKSGVYDNLDENGLIRIGSVVRVGDCLIGKIRTIIRKGNVIKEDASSYAEIGQAGIVDEVIVTTNASGFRVAYVKIRQVRKPQVGSKFASRSAQKSTIGLILPEEDMPFTKNGIKPDIILNPHAIPSRMTIGKLIEIVASKLGALRGERINATAYQKFDLEELKRNLKAYGFEESGKEIMYNGMTGRPFISHVFIGPCYYQRLRHDVEDKIAMRGYGPVDQSTRQPVGGRKKRGGLKFGEMERDALISHGATDALVDTLCVRSDAFTATYCKDCGQIAVQDTERLGFSCQTCDNENFGVCTIPYSFKLFTQLLAAAHIKIKLNLKEVNAGRTKIVAPFSPQPAPTTGLQPIQVPTATKTPQLI